jgi:signal peptidase I
MSANVPSREIQLQESSWVRSIVELSVCLTILVSLFRVFLAGGYMIETGSMAPCLLGKHHPVVCPSCQFRFAVEGSSVGSRAVCPNCDEPGIPVDDFPVYEGDHLLVHRGLYDFRAPRRWEVIVFQNPAKPRQAYVKRLVGLPGESVQIRGGDVYIAGEIQTKDYATQCGVRIPVYDHDFRPSAGSPEWKARWQVPRESRSWRETEGKFRFSPGTKSGKSPGAPSGKPAEYPGDYEWVNYRHWIRSGGSHKTSVPFAGWSDALDRFTQGFSPLVYDAASRSLICRGAMPVDLRDQMLAACDDPECQTAIADLYESSHIAPIVDQYGYNPQAGSGEPPSAAKTPHEVRDLMLSLQVQFRSGPGSFVLDMSDGTSKFHCVLNGESRQVQLWDSRRKRLLRTAHWEGDWEQKPVHLEMSLMDRQVLVALNGKVSFEPFRYPAPARQGETPWIPVRFGARGTGVEVSGLKLYRDVFYAETKEGRAVDQPLRLRSNEFFVLGDNSPVSFDSRSWDHDAVLTDSLLLGKPLVVHLPSGKKKFHFLGREFEMRVLEPSRMRFIH